MVVDPFGQLGDRRDFEQGLDGDVGAEFDADFRQQPHGRQRMSTQVEERVIDADPVHVEDLTEQRGQCFFAFVARGPIGRAGGELRCGQGPLVEFAVHRQRQGIQHHDRRGHHVVGQLLGEEFAQLGHPLDRRRIVGVSGHRLRDRHRPVQVRQYRRCGVPGNLGHPGEDHLDPAGVRRPGHRRRVAVSPAQLVELVRQHHLRCGDARLQISDRGPAVGLAQRIHQCHIRTDLGIGHPGDPQPLGLLGPQMVIQGIQVTEPLPGFGGQAGHRSHGRGHRSLA